MAEMFINSTLYKNGRKAHIRIVLIYDFKRESYSLGKRSEDEDVLPDIGTSWGNVTTIGNIQDILERIKKRNNGRS